MHAVLPSLVAFPRLVKSARAVTDRRAAVSSLLMRMTGEENRGGGGHVRDDEATFAALYPSLRRFAAVVGNYHDDPDDLVQEALTRVLAAGGLGVARDPARNCARRS